MTWEGLEANARDLSRIAWLESSAYFPPGFTVEAVARVNAYLWRIWWLATVRRLPGAPPYPGPREC